MQGTLTINIDPPYICFDTKISGHKHRYQSECTLDNIHEVLLELTENEIRWPLKDGIIRYDGKFSAELLEKFRLIQSKDSRRPIRTLLQDTSCSQEK